MPGVVIGHNQDIAWGMTNLGADVTDLYLEKVTGDGYLYDGKAEALHDPQGDHQGRRRREPRRSPSARPTTGRSSPTATTNCVKVGKKAPVDNAAPDRGDGYARRRCAGPRWTPASPWTPSSSSTGPRTGTSFRKAAARLRRPLAEPDLRRHQGQHRLPGARARSRSRGKGDGRYARRPAGTREYRWTGYIPQDALPYEYNPERGYIVTANQAVIDQDKYPYLLTTDWGYGARSQRINDLIESKIKDGGKISTDDMQTMQMDNSSEIAKLLVPYLLKIDVDDKYVREAQKLLEGWDYTQDADSAAAAYFNAVWRNILKLAFGNKLPKELRVKGQCLNVAPGRRAPAPPTTWTASTVRECGAARRGHGAAGRRRPLVRGGPQPHGRPGQRLVEDARGTRDRPGDTNRDELLARAMKDARWELTAKLGKDIDTWSWGRLHQLILKNQTLGTDGPGFLQCILNRGPWNLGGGEAAVNATGWNAAGGYERHLGAVDADGRQPRRPRQVPWINLTGASGHAYNAHYTDQTDKWAKGELLPWSFSETRPSTRAPSDTLVAEAVSR